MRKIKIVLTILAITLLLSACNSGDDAVLFDDGSLNADNRLEEILAAIDENDSDELENMFSKTTLSQVDNFQEQTENLFQLFEGTVKSWERTGFTSSSTIEDREKNRSEYCLVRCDNRQNGVCVFHNRMHQRYRTT